ncbi:adenylate/guanylate cyclase domain-containing protein [Nevskia soli]|uniref:adenylate/guanylate cyclase domain-containing protein n=1 Tax=Nevskia soli TaxID=418856 RepID=UPI0004A6D99A|nr:adenylate/guanylate cyclase domain-containing protein [Nevskia soli]
MTDPVLLESAVADWLWTEAKDLLVRPKGTRWPDYELRTAQGALLLLEVSARAPDDIALHRLTRRLGAISDQRARFLLLTPEAPTAGEAKRFENALRHAPIKAQWLAIQELPKLLGKPSPGPWNSPATWSQLQANALVQGIESYREAPIGPAPYAPQPPTTSFQSLARQFSYETIARLTHTAHAPPVELGLGTRRENVTIVLSDIVNFSSMVAASRPDDLQALMGQYYQRARQAVFEHGGMLDKFIGDAVLAVFGYPEPRASAPADAIRFANALVGIGHEIMEDWQSQLNAVISTGTRVGIATGDIWPINIGQRAVEITLLGDTINLAARLEKNCEVDKLLIDNRTRTAALRTDADFIAGLCLRDLVIPAQDVKGQAFAVRAWKTS